MILLFKKIPKHPFCKDAAVESRCFQNKNLEKIVLQAASIVSHFYAAVSATGC